MQTPNATNRPETRAGLPVPLQARAPRPSLMRSTTPAAFVSQLLAARGRIDLQRQKRRAPVETAISAYRSGATVAVKRMPAGYRTTIVV